MSILGTFIAFNGGILFQFLATKFREARDRENLRNDQAQQAFHDSMHELARDGVLGPGSIVRVSKSGPTPEELQFIREQFGMNPRQFEEPEALLEEKEFKDALTALFVIGCNNCNHWTVSPEQHQHIFENWKGVCVYPGGAWSYYSDFGEVHFHADPSVQGGIQIGGGQ